MSRNRNFHTFDTYDSVFISEKESLGLRFLYHTLFGRLILWLLIQPIFSKIIGWFLNRKCSLFLVPSFIKKNQIDMSRFEQKKYSSFNDFFSRKLISSKEPFNEHTFLAPCDGKLSFYEISDELTFSVKKSIYSVQSLIQDESIASRYRHGVCLIFRLTPDDYHRYHFVDEGSILFSKKIAGVFHTVRPIAFLKYPVFHENTREVTVMNTRHFGMLIEVEVGALMVGKIENHNLKHFQALDEKGTFLFGGSTIILLIEPGKVDFNPLFLENTQKQVETVLHYRDILGFVKKL